MPAQFRPGKFYRMPVGFGPTPGPRMVPKAKESAFPYSSRRKSAQVTYTCDPKQLERILPPQFTLRGEPLVTFEIHHLSEVSWLAGRSYAAFGVKFPVTCHGKVETVKGDFLSVLWENMADPIMSGREELGYSKIFCDIHEPKVMGNTHSYACSWQGFPFFEMTISDVGEGAAPKLAAASDSQGTLHYKYIPKTGSPGHADVAYPTLTPLENPSFTVEKRAFGTGAVRFVRARWEDLPTMHHIVNTFARLRLGDVQSASVTWAHGGKDLSDQRPVN